MALLERSDWVRARALARFGYANPFLPEREQLERVVLDSTESESPRVRQREPGRSLEAIFPHIPQMLAEGDRLLSMMRERLVAGTSASDDELDVYQDVALVTLYLRYASNLAGRLAADMAAMGSSGEVASWRDFEREFRHWLHPPGVTLPSPPTPQHAIAVFFQIERAHAHIFEHIAGGSLVAARLRATVWESIFTHDTSRYTRFLYRRMHEIPTLVTGPSGSGKELVARAIGLSRYIPFDPVERRFAGEESFNAVNLAAFATTLVESELFGHVAGAFTGAIADREGWFEVCPPHGSVFLDEIAEVEPAVQVKLLRVLQERGFQRIGESSTRPFEGKVVAATNRDLAGEIRSGRFREDLYYRLCADVVWTPSLQAQLASEPEDLPNLVRVVVARVLVPARSGEPAPPESRDEIDSLTNRAVEWIDQHLGRAYAWPGNFRELEQCVRNVMIRGEYRPSRSSAPDAADRLLAEAVQSGELTSDELLDRYYRHVLRREGTLRGAARRLAVNWRTVKRRVGGQTA